MSVIVMPGLEVAQTINTGGSLPVLLECRSHSNSFAASDDDRPAMVDRYPRASYYYLRCTGGG